MYNFRIADYHTYFVGGAAWGFDVWAHNRCTWWEAEDRAKLVATRRGETIIPSNPPVPPGMRRPTPGFDFLSYQQLPNGQYQLFITEVKRFSNPISATRFTAFGLGRGGSPVFERNLDSARAQIQEITDQNIRVALLDQLDNQTALIRVVARRGLVDNNVVNFIKDQTGFLTRLGY